MTVAFVTHVFDKVSIVQPFGMAEHRGGDIYSIVEREGRYCLRRGASNGADGLQGARARRPRLNREGAL